MTTSNSPLRKIKLQADRTAKCLKDMSRGVLPPIGDPAGKLAAALKKDSITFGIVMDDKIVKVEMPWTLIRETSESGISEWIVNHMHGQQPSVQ